MERASNILTLYFKYISAAFFFFSLLEIHGEDCNARFAPCGYLISRNI